MPEISDLIELFEEGDCPTAEDFNSRFTAILQYVCETFQTKGEPGPAPIGAIAIDGTTKITGPLCYAEGVEAAGADKLPTLGQIQSLIKNFCQCFSDRTSVVTDENGIACIPIPPGEINAVFGAVMNLIDPANGYATLVSADNDEVCFKLYDSTGTVKVSEPVNVSYIVLGQ